ncbi:GNAT family N-acetyltransferase [Roseicitreum antarcticum]|uniref:Protein N-acetyltransferase, RimJ/RimL family n=1 Tax=Roseicitreum antarcticum TaxID=564137 RepID=A0A1H3BKP4_9RHOB|nr:GNAT family N-acetyltransferase [Roseicitreum antarcticum]SDX42513.1 Protein N-acetyltransferase, RimJ/RimL family [Roseicitreum antarcticum]
MTVDTKISDQATIETDRLTLRPLRRSDAGLLSFYTADRRVAEGTRSIPHPLPPGATEAFVSQAIARKRDEDIWVMDGQRHGSAEVIGLISLKPLDRGQSQIGYWVAPAFWNTGFASEAVSALVKANPHDATTLFAEVFQDNAISARVLTNCGFQYLGDAEAFSVARGKAVPTWTYIHKV